MKPMKPMKHGRVPALAVVTEAVLVLERSLAGTGGIHGDRLRPGRVITLKLVVACRFLARGIG